MTRCTLIWPTGSGLGVAVGTGVFVAAGAADPPSGVAVGLKELSVARGVGGASGIAVGAGASGIAVGAGASGIAVAAGMAVASAISVVSSPPHATATTNTAINVRNSSVGTFEILGTIEQSSLRFFLLKWQP
jgi:DNA uptake protein ComE-like DNA-binding protein